MICVDVLSLTTRPSGNKVDIYSILTITVTVSRHTTEGSGEGGDSRPRRQTFLLSLSSALCRHHRYHHHCYFYLVQNLTQPAAYHYTRKSSLFSCLFRKLSVDYCAYIPYMPIRLLGELHSTLSCKIIVIRSQLIFQHTFPLLCRLTFRSSWPD